MVLVAGVIAGVYAGLSSHSTTSQRQSIGFKSGDCGYNELTVIFKQPVDYLRFLVGSSHQKLATLQIGASVFCS